MWWFFRLNQRNNNVLPPTTYHDITKTVNITTDDKSEATYIPPDTAHVIIKNNSKKFRHSRKTCVQFKNNLVNKFWSQVKRLTSHVKSKV